jgi:hypothetical protein
MLLCDPCHYGARRVVAIVAAWGSLSSDVAILYRAVWLSLA